MTLQKVTCGYLPLLDCAPLVIAQELKFAAQEGLEMQLMRQPSWSALRDRLAFGQIDFAHMLSPMPVAMSLGLGSAATRVDALMVLSVNGTVIGVSRELEQKMHGQGWQNCFADPEATAEALFAAQDRPLRIGVPFPFSMHRLLLEIWLRQSPGYAPAQFQIVTVPPPQMAEAVLNGNLDMFCVGEPWGTVAVQQSRAALILPGSSIWSFAPEKVLGVRHQWGEQNPDLCQAMIRAIAKATQWLDQPENTPLAVSILARSQHLDLPEQFIDPGLTGQIVIAETQAPQPVAHFLEFHRSAANFPWRSQASWIAEQLARSHGLTEPDYQTLARQCFRPDVYRAALQPTGLNLPGASEKVEGSMIVPTAVASTLGQMILGPDGFFNGAQFDFGPSILPQK